MPTSITYTDPKTGRSAKIVIYETHLYTFRIPHYKYDIAGAKHQQ